MKYCKSEIMPKKLIVNVPVTDLRREPVPAAWSYEKDPLQESQLLFGEHLLGYEEREGWYRIEAIEQQKFTSQGWQGYPGWVQKMHVIEIQEHIRNNPLIVQIPWGAIRIDGHELPVSLGTRLEGVAQTAEGWQVRMPDGRNGLILAAQVSAYPTSSPQLTDSKRQDILTLGNQLLGQPYLWGGLSAYRSDCLSSCDCSGLVGLLYRVQGIDLPRDAHDQYLKCTKITFSVLEPGDLLFLSSVERPQRMGHVMLYAGGDELLDANIADRKAVRTTALSRFGKRFEEMSWGEQVGKYTIYAGRYMEIEEEA